MRVYLTFSQGTALHGQRPANSSFFLFFLKVVDARGNPLLISGVVRYFWANSVQTLLECEQPSQYVDLLATAVLKQIISRYESFFFFFFFFSFSDSLPLRYPYETHDGSPCLKTESSVITNELISALQQRVSASGAKILSLNINEVRRSKVVVQFN
jgi:hypothetical protein